MNRLVGKEKPRILDSCTGCGYCFLLCPHGAVRAGQDAGYRIEAELCNECGKCIFACPVGAVAGVPDPEFARESLAERDGGVENYDAVVIGSGIGGLFSAAALSRKGKKTVLVERLNFTGGRFTHFVYEGAFINTGACHAVPFGKKGPFAEMVKSLEIPVNIISAGGMGSLYVSGKQYRWQEIMEFMAPFSMREKADLLKIIPKVLKPQKINPPGLSFGRWLDGEVSSELIRAFFDRMFNFGCSVGIDEIDYDEAVKIINNVYFSKAPGVIEGGCGFLVEKLVDQVRSNGGTVLLETEAAGIITRDEKAEGVKIKNRRTGAMKTLASELVISDIGPLETRKLLHAQDVQSFAGVKGHERSGVTKGEVKTAVAVNPGENEKRPSQNETGGLCINMICDVPLLAHASILYCLDTKRVAGIAQPTGVDPGLAPEGKHLLIAYQMLKSDNPARELELGLADLKTMFGKKFDKHCRVINTGVFKNGWPVNRSAQGRDHSPYLPVEGLYLVGDGCKAPGFVMVEGIAAQVKDVLARIDSSAAEQPLQP